MEKSAQQVIRYLQDAHATELGISQMLKEFLEDPIDGDKTRQLFAGYYQVTNCHVQKLEKRLKELGAELSAGIGFFSALLSKTDEMMESLNDVHGRTTHNLIKCYAAQHFQEGMYSCLSGYALTGGDLETEALADEFVSEVEDAALVFYPMIESCALRAEDSRR
ncbi:MAG TPA: DUF892 family protein [Fimbriimonadaceae bacterium]|jgi:ferritin-like metal-binding protein YciE